MKVINSKKTKLTKKQYFMILGAMVASLSLTAPVLSVKTLAAEDEEVLFEDQEDDYKTEDIKEDDVVQDNTVVEPEPAKEETKPEEQKQEEPKQEENKSQPKLKEEEISTKLEDKPENSDNNKAQTQAKVQNQTQAKIKDNNQKAPKKELPKSLIHKGLYYEESYDFKTNIQQNNKLLEFAKNKKNIQITISEPKKEVEGGFFSKAIFSYRVQCPELGSDVRRTYADFEWLRNQLSIRYPLRLIPVVVKENILKQMGKNLKDENEENFELRKIRFLYKFIQSVLEKKILATSPILYEFLVYDEKNLAKYKKFLEKKPYELEVNLNNLITVKGEVKCAIKQTTVNDSEMIINKSISLNDLYNGLITNIDLVINDFNNLTKHFKEISIIFNKMNQNLTAYKYPNADEIKGNFNNLKSLFEKWSKNINSQTEFFNNIIKENFNYMNLELNEINQTFNKYRNYKFEYEDFTSMINKEKENVINGFINEELRKEENRGKKPNQIKFNRNKLEEIFYSKNLLLIEEKKRLVTTMHYLIKDYNKLISLHGKKIKEINDSVQKTVVIDFINE